MFYIQAVAADNGPQTCQSFSCQGHHTQARSYLVWGWGWVLGNCNVLEFEVPYLHGGATSKELAESNLALCRHSLPEGVGMRSGLQRFDLYVPALRLHTRIHSFPVSNSIATCLVADL